MDWFIQEMKNPYSASILAGFIVFAFMYVDARVSKRETTRGTYAKNIFMTMFVVGLVVYCISAYSSLPAPKVTGVATGGAPTVSGINYSIDDVDLRTPNW
jgi:hypothetical protein